MSAGDFDLSGNSLAGTLAFGAGLSLNSSSVLRFDLDSVASDLISVTGNLSLAGSLNVIGLSGFGKGAYTLFTYTGSLTDGGLSLAVLPDGYTGTLDYSQAGSVILNVAAVPEPATIALLGLALVGVVWMKTHRRLVL